MCLFNTTHHHSRIISRVQFNNKYLNMYGISNLIWFPFVDTVYRHCSGFSSGGNCSKFKLYSLNKYASFVSVYRAYKCFLYMLYILMIGLWLIIIRNVYNIVQYYYANECVELHIRTFVYSFEIFSALQHNVQYNTSTPTHIFSFIYVNV